MCIGEGLTRTALQTLNHCPLVANEETQPPRCKRGGVPKRGGGAAATKKMADTIKWSATTTV